MGYELALPGLYNGLWAGPARTI